MMWEVGWVFVRDSKKVVFYDIPACFIGLYLSLFTFYAIILQIMKIAQYM